MLNSPKYPKKMTKAPMIEPTDMAKKDLFQSKSISQAKREAV